MCSCVLKSRCPVPSSQSSLATEQDLRHHMQKPTSRDPLVQSLRRASLQPILATTAEDLSRSHRVGFFSAGPPVESSRRAVLRPFLKTCLLRVTLPIDCLMWVPLDRVTRARGRSNSADSCEESVVEQCEESQRFFAFGIGVVHSRARLHVPVAVGCNLLSLTRCFCSICLTTIVSNSLWTWRFSKTAFTCT